MKRLAFILVISLCITAVSFSQTVYPVSPGTRNNQIVLTVANESPQTAAAAVEVRLMKHAAVLTFPEPVLYLENLEPGQEAAATFAFDIPREAPVNMTDTLEFRITDDKGGSWTKSIILQFAPPATYKLEQNFPNPFNPLTTIHYQLPAAGQVNIQVYDLLGRHIRTLVNGNQPAGYHTTAFDASALASGVYIYRMKAGSFSSVRKMMVMK
ncbi:MAG: T9SS type A sorting domain-containing protein [Calditrichia bacterium]